MTRRLLIVNADDLGYDPEVSRGILEALEAGVVTSTTLMVNTPFSEEAARAAHGRAVGLHLNLARHAPVSAEIPGELLSKGQFDEGRAGELGADAVEAEALAQLDRFAALAGQEPTHVDVHKHLHRHAGVLEGLARAARSRDLPVRSIDAGMRASLARWGVRTNDDFIGDAGPAAYWTLEQLEADLAKVRDGVTELMCHPGYAPVKVQSGYAAQREVELRTFADPRAREAIRRAGIVLADWRALRRA
jgi:hypothetical protein